MKFTETTAETQTALLAAAIVKAVDYVSGDYGDKVGKIFATTILKSIGLTDKHFKALFNPTQKSKQVQNEISAVMGINKEMFHMIQLVYRDSSTEELIMDNQCGQFLEIGPLLTEVKALGIVDNSILPRQNSFLKRCFIADATYRFNKVHRTRHGMTPKQTAKTKKVRTSKVCK